MLLNILRTDGLFTLVISIWSSGVSVYSFDILMHLLSILCLNTGSNVKKKISPKLGCYMYYFQYPSKAYYQDVTPETPGETDQSQQVWELPNHTINYLTSMVCFPHCHSHLRFCSLGGAPIWLCPPQQALHPSLPLTEA